MKITFKYIWEMVKGTAILFGWLLNHPFSSSMDFDLKVRQLFHRIIEKSFDLSSEEATNLLEVIATNVTKQK